MSATFTHGQRVVAGPRDACCPACRSAYLEFRAPSSAESGVFACADCGESFIRNYADLSALGPSTGHVRPADPAIEDLPSYPAPGSAIPGQPGFVVGDCGHRVAGTEWRAGFRNCERCPNHGGVADPLRRIPTGPIEEEPIGAIQHGNRRAFAAALDGIELGAHDRAILDWLSGYEPSTVATICSWLLRARAAGGGR